MKNFYLLLFGFTLLFTSCEKEATQDIPDTKDFEYVNIDSITTNTTFRSDIVYRIHKELIITNGATLTIQPGTALLFGSYSGLIVKDNASIFAQGTADQPIFFSSDYGRYDDKEWGGLKFIDQAGESTFEHCVFEYGGNFSIEYPYNDYEYGLILAQYGTLNISHSTFHTTGGSPILLIGAAKFGSFHNNTFEESTNHLRITANAIHTLGKDNLYDSINAIEIIGNLDIEGSYTWQNQKIRFIFIDDFTLGSLNGTSLTLEPGIEFQTRNRTYFFIGKNTTMKGQLIAIGTSDNPIIFRGYHLVDVEDHGEWEGIRIVNLSGNSEFKYCTISNGGYRDGNLEIWDPLTNYTLTISNCLIKNSARWGIAKDNTQSISPILTNNTFVGNLYGDLNW